MAKRNSGLKNLIVSVLVLFALFPVLAFSASPLSLPNGWTDGFVYVNGIRIHYYRAIPAPGKPVIVMVHGVMDSGLTWGRVAPELQADYDIYMLDSRGHGLSDPFTASDNGESMIKDVVGFVQVMNLEKPILMGHSLGAATVMRVGAEYPDLAKAVVMLDPFITRSNPGVRQPAPQRAAVSTPDNPAPQRAAVSKPDSLAVTMSGSPEALVKQNNYSFDALVAKAHRDNPKWDMVDCRYWAQSISQYHGPYTQNEWQALSGTMNTGNALSAIPVPALILKADAPEAERTSTRESISNFTKVKLVYVDGAAHNLHRDQLGLTVKLLREFLTPLNR